MINFLQGVKQHLHDFVENGHNKPIHLKQNQLINDIYQALEGKKMVMLTAGQKTYKGYINRYDKERQCLFIQQERIITMLDIKDIQRLKVIQPRG